MCLTLPSLLIFGLNFVRFFCYLVFLEKWKHQKYISKLTELDGVFIKDINNEEEGQNLFESKFSNR